MSRCFGVAAALAALSIHGEADTAVTRAKVVAAFRRFIRTRPAMASFAVTDPAEESQSSPTCNKAPIRRQRRR